MGRHFWFVAAGTGGHIFPGLSVAAEITRQAPTTSFLFWGDASRLESELVPRAGYPIKFLRVEQFKGKSKIKKIFALVGVGVSLIKVLTESFRRKPVALVSVGGYVSVPVALAARIRNIPIFLIEPNSVSGVANVLVSKWAIEAYVSPAGPASTKLKCAVVKTGNPVRADLPAFTVKSRVENILVLGGSQGALKLSHGAVMAAIEMNSLGLNFRWTIQVGEKNLDEIKTLVARVGHASFIDVVAFIQDVGRAYASADLLVSRAGATTLAEIAVVGVPNILVPFPHAADDHQRLNARILEAAGAARTVDEVDADFEKKLSAQLRDLCASESGFQKRTAMHLKLKEFGRPHASQDISNRILSHADVTAKD